MRGHRTAIEKTIKQPQEATKATHLVRANIGVNKGRQLRWNRLQPGESKYPTRNIDGEHRDDAEGVGRARSHALARGLQLGGDCNRIKPLRLQQTSDISGKAGGVEAGAQLGRQGVGVGEKRRDGGCRVDVVERGFLRHYEEYRDKRGEDASARLWNEGRLL